MLACRIYTTVNGMAVGQVLVVDDEPDIRSTVKEILEDEGYRVVLAENAAAAREARRSVRPDVILLDIWMPDIDGITLLREWSERGGLSCPVIMMSGHGTIETAVEATRLGAYDFIEKPISLAKLLLTIERALENERLKRENEGLRRQVPFTLEPIGSSKAILMLKAQIEKLAAHDTSVLIQGEPGTGKETLARYLHDKSARRNGPFVTIDPTGINRGDAATVVFGSEGPNGIQYGLLEQANSGSLFLNDLGELDADIQLRLANALERRSLLRSGGREPVALDLRLISATTKDLDSLIKSGRLREELYYQINVVPLHVPPLRDRPEDISDILRFYADFFPNRDKLPYRHFSVAVQNRLRQHTWPGNIHELRNLVQRLLILGTGEVQIAEIEATLNNEPLDKSGNSIDFRLPLREAREQFERSYLLQRLNEAGGSVGRLAKNVGMERTHLYRKLRDLGVDVKASARDE